MSFDPASLDVVCFYVDFGRPYAPLMEQMCSSAKRALPGCRTVLLTPTPQGAHAEPFDTICHLDFAPDSKTLCRDRAVAMASWNRSGERPCIFVDPDIEFRRAPKLFEGWDVGLLWRKKPDQPINTGLIVSKPRLNAFWAHYATIVINLPRPVHYWWCDQLGFALLTGVCHEGGETVDIDGARVRLLSAPEHCDTPENAGPDAWAVHYKGRLKGEGWDRIFVSGGKSGAGKSSPASAF